MGDLNRGFETFSSIRQFAVANKENRHLEFIDSETKFWTDPKDRSSYAETAKNLRAPSDEECRLTH